MGLQLLDEVQRETIVILLVPPLSTIENNGQSFRMAHARRDSILNTKWEVVVEPKTYISALRIMSLVALSNGVIDNPHM